jgi:hypothetical protein
VEKQEIESRIRDEFPGDEALQQVHLARAFLQQKAADKGMTLAEYVRSLGLAKSRPRT